MIMIVAKYLLKISLSPTRVISSEKVINFYDKNIIFFGVSQKHETKCRKLVKKIL